MTEEKIQEVVAKYRNILEAGNYPKEKFLEHGTVCFHPTAYRAFCHVHYMLDEIEKFLEEGRIEKANRWLGFIQGVFWTCGTFALYDLKNHNRP